MDSTQFLANKLEIQHPSHRGRCIATNKSNGKRCGKVPAAHNMRSAEELMDTVWMKACRGEQVTYELLDIAELMTCKATARVNHQDQVPRMVEEWLRRLKNTGLNHVEVLNEHELTAIWTDGEADGSADGEETVETERCQVELRIDVRKAEVPHRPMKKREMFLVAILVVLAASLQT